MFVSRKHFTKMLEEEMERYESESREEEKELRTASVAFSGAEHCFRPWELLSPGRSLYFPWGRKRCRERLARVIGGCLSSGDCRRLDITGAGPYGKIALSLAEEAVREHPGVEIRVWLPGPVCLSRYRRDLERFHGYHCSLAYFDYPDNILRMETAMLLHSSAGACFTLNPRAKKRLALLSEKTGRRVFRLDGKDFEQESSPR